MSKFDWPRDNAELIAQLARQRDRYEQLVRNMSDLLMLIEPDGTVSFCNRRVVPEGQEAAYPQVGSRAIECVGEPDRPAIERALGDVLHRRAERREVLFRIDDGAGGQRIIEGTFAPVIEAERVSQVEFLGRDVTERERAAGALREVNEALTRQQNELDRDLGVAAKVHISLLPRPMATDRVLIDLKHVPLLGVGGDYVHIHRADPLRPALTVFDVSGHGVASALVAGRVHSAVYAIMQQHSAPPEMLQRLNRFVYNSFSDLGVFVTLFTVQLDLQQGRACYCGAGHPPALLKRSGGGPIVRLPSQHLPVGVRTSVFGEGDPTSQVEIAPGDTIWVYTDGLVELGISAEAILGVDGLVKRVEKIDTAEPQLGLAERSLAEILTGFDHRDDDITLVIAAVR